MPSIVGGLDVHRKQLTLDYVNTVTGEVACGRCWSAITICGAEHTAWVQRIHATLFHQGAPCFRGLAEAGGPDQLTGLAGEHLSASGQAQIAVSLRILGALETELAAMRRRLVQASPRLRGAKVLTESIYGVGPITGLALTCWLGGAGRFTSARKAVRFCGLDVTVYSSAGKRSPGTCPGRDRRSCAGAPTRPARPVPARLPRTMPTTPG